MPDAVSPLFDSAFYREAYPDLAHLSAAAAHDHYEAFGRAEGRIASPLATREGLLALPRAAHNALEIGPFCAPMLRGAGVRYLDVLDARQLKERAVSIGLDPAGCPEQIDYLGGLGDIKERFEAVVSCHSIEHQPDLVRHLGEVAKVLEPGGRYYLIVPDKRFCFDHFIAESTIAGVLDAHREGRSLHGLGSVVEHVALSTHNDPARHWRGDHGVAPGPDLAGRVRAALAHFGDGTGYVDVHAWYFTPPSFRRIVDTLHALDMIGLRALAVYDTPRDRQEFCAVLERVNG